MKEDWGPQTHESDPFGVTEADMVALTAAVKAVIFYFY